MDYKHLTSGYQLALTVCTIRCRTYPDFGLQSVVKQYTVSIALPNFTTYQTSDGSRKHVHFKVCCKTAFYTRNLDVSLSATIIKVQSNVRD